MFAPAREKLATGCKRGYEECPPEERESRTKTSRVARSRCARERKKSDTVKPGVRSPAFPGAGPIRRTTSLAYRSVVHVAAIPATTWAGASGCQFTCGGTDSQRPAFPDEPPRERVARETSASQCKRLTHATLRGGWPRARLRIKNRSKAGGLRQVKTRRRSIGAGSSP